MKSLLIATLCFFSNAFGFAQNDNHEKFHLNIKAGVGLHRFHVTGYVTEDYPSLASKLGLAVSKSIFSNRFELESGISVFLRNRSESPLENGMIWTGKGYRLPLLDKTATESHSAVEIPFLVRYLFLNGKSINAGLIIRQWGAETPTDLLASQTELVGSFGISQNLNERFTASLDINLGVSKIWEPTLVVRGYSRAIVIRNQSALLSVSYSL